MTDDWTVNLEQDYLHEQAERERLAGWINRALPLLVRYKHTDQAVRKFIDEWELEHLERDRKRLGIADD